MPVTHCTTCSHIPDRVMEEAAISNYRNTLKKIGMASQYYRGADLQLSLFQLYTCPDCGTFYEDGNHYYSDPESSMGLVRDEREWVALTRLKPEKAVNLLGRIYGEDEAEKETIQLELERMRSLMGKG